jgi:hypothetical protein
MSNTIDQQREAFEKWMAQYIPQTHFNRDGDGRYIMYYTDQSWLAWQAGFDAAIEHERKNSAAAELLAALCEIVKRNEIQHWFNLDQAKAAIEHAKKTNRKGSADADVILTILTIGVFLLPLLYAAWIGFLWCCGVDIDAYSSSR